MKHQTALAVALIVSLGAAARAAAQDAEAVQGGPALTRFTLGLAAQLSEPKEEFRLNVDNGFGIGGHARYNLDRSGILSLRLDIAWLSYGRETKRVPFSQTVGGRILVDVTTTNSIIAFGFGPQLQAVSGPIRPYMNLALSGLVFSTTSSVEGTRSSDEPIASTTNYSDGTAAWVLGGGVQIPLGGQTNRFALDIGARYHRGGEASYLREGSIVDNPDGSITITPLHSRTPFMIYTLGFSIQLWHDGPGYCPPALC